MDSRNECLYGKSGIQLIVKIGEHINASPDAKKS